jgi:hypothetical protein
MELEYFGYPKASRMAGNLGMAMLFERYLLRANTASSAATEIRKNIGVENRPERESYQVHSLTSQ